MMNKKRILLILLLTIFITGICINTVSAAHIIKVGKYKAKLTDKQYNYLKKVYHDKADVNFQSYHIKTKNYKKIKKPIYKTKKVTKTKWVYKNVLKSKTVYKTKNYDTTEYEYSTAKYDKSWKWYGSYSIDKDYEWGWESKYYYKYKKKVKYAVKKKVKTGKYKIIKKPIYFVVISDNSPYASALVYYTGMDGEDKYIKEKRLKF